MKNILTLRTMIPYGQNHSFSKSVTLLSNHHIRMKFSNSQTNFHCSRFKLQPKHFDTRSQQQKNPFSSKIKNRKNFSLIIARRKNSLTTKIQNIGKELYSKIQQAKNQHFNLGVQKAIEIATSDPLRTPVRDFPSTSFHQTI